MMTTQTLHSRFEILLVEDNPGDIRLIREAVKECSIPVRMTVKKDGSAAIEYLHQKIAGSESPIPDLILLDLNLPVKDGLEVLREIKSTPHLRRIPVVVLSSSESAQDIARAYELYANCYITKPSDLDKFIEAIDAIYGFWLNIVELPEKDSRA